MSVSRTTPIQSRCVPSPRSFLSRLPVSQRLKFPLSRLSLLPLSGTLLIALLACESGFPGTENPVTCAADAECQEAGSVCLLGVCTSADEGLLTEVDLEIRPPDGIFLPPQQLLDVDITINDRILIDLRDVAGGRSRL